MRSVVQCTAVATLALAIFCGCGGPRLDLPPSVVSTDDKHVVVENATLEMVARKQVVRVRLAIYEALPSDLLYDVVTSEGGTDAVVKQDVPTGIDGTEPGSRTIDVPAEEALRGGKIVFHLAEVPASQEAPASQPGS